MSTGSINLTPKQEKFCIVYIETGNASEAYRRAYDVKSGTKEATINRQAKAILDNPKIAARVKAISKPVIKKAQMTLEKHLKDLEELREGAKNDLKWSAAVQAEIARGKAAGLYVERHEVSGPDGSPIPVSATIDAASLSTSTLEELLAARERATDKTD